MRSPATARLVLLLLTALPLAAVPCGATPRPQDPPSVQGLPTAPPPSGIRPSRKAEERRAEPPVPVPDTDPVPRRATSRVLDEALTLEVRGMERSAADAALRAAVSELRDAERLLDPHGDAANGLAALDAAAGGEPVALDPRLIDLLQRALSFCIWSGGAHGPLGGDLYALWGFGSAATGRPTAASLERAVEAAGCDRLRIDETSASVQLADGSRVELWGFARGFLVDRAMAVLEEHGAENAYVELGWVRRALGSRDSKPEEEGRGWPVTLPVFPGQDRPLDRVWLRDESLSVASALHRPLIVGGDRYAPYLDQRDGQPAKGVTGVVTVTQIAVDAEALAASMMILGNRQGQLLVGGLKPSPSVLWLLGGGEGVPLLAQYDWSRIALR